MFSCPRLLLEDARIDAHYTTRVSFPRRRLRCALTLASWMLGEAVSLQTRPIRGEYRKEDTSNP